MQEHSTPQTSMCQRGSLPTAWIAIFALLVVVVAGCQSEDVGEALSFNHGVDRIQNGYALDQVLAERAYLEIEVCCGEILSVKPVSPEIVDIVSTGETSFQLQGRRAGTATIKVETTTGEGTINVEVGAIAKADFKVQPWAEEFALPDELFDNGVAMLPNSPVRLKTTLYDSDDRPLIGDGLPEATLADNSRATLQAHGGGEYTFRSEEALGLQEIYFAGASLSLEVIEPERVAELALYDVQNQVEYGLQDPVEMRTGEASLLHVILRDDTQRYVVGAGSPPLVVGASEGDFATLLTGTTEADDDDFKRALTRARAIIAIPAFEGEASMAVSVAGLHADLNLVATPK